MTKIVSYSKKTCNINSDIKNIEFFGGKTTFEYQKIRDNIKNDFAKKNGFTLLRIRGNMSEDCVRKKIEKNIARSNAEALSDRV